MVFQMKQVFYQKRCLPYNQGQDPDSGNIAACMPGVPFHWKQEESEKELPGDRQENDRRTGTDEDTSDTISI